MLAKYAKLWVYVVIAAVGAVATTLGPGNKNLGDLGTDDWLITIAAILVSGAFVAAVSNIPGVAGGIAKTVVAFIGAIVTTWHAALADAFVTQAEWLGIISAGLAAAVAVYQTKNAE